MVGISTLTRHSLHIGQKLPGESIAKAPHT